MRREKTKIKKGFTLVETVFVLSISGLMLLSFMAGIASMVGSQRYSDATNDFVDFLRRIYSETINVQNSRTGALTTTVGDSEYYYCNLAGLSAHLDGKLDVAKTDGLPGRTSCAIYGKLITFGEKDDDTLYVYDVIGLAIDINHPIAASNTATELAAVYIDTLTFKTNSNGSCSVEPAGAVESYHPSWGTRIESTVSDDALYRGALLIVRSPDSGAVRTYVLENQTPNIQTVISDRRNESCTAGVANSMREETSQKANLVDHLIGSDEENNYQLFEQKEADFCIGSDQLFANIGRRNNVRVAVDGHNSTAVEFVETDLTPEEGGNRCQ